MAFVVFQWPYSGSAWLRCFASFLALPNKWSLYMQSMWLFKDRASFTQRHQTCSLTLPLLLQRFHFWFFNRVWNPCHVFAKMVFVKAFSPLLDERGRWRSSSIWRVCCLMQMFNTHSIVYTTATADQGMLQLSSAVRQRQGASKRTLYCRCEKWPLTLLQVSTCMLNVPRVKS